MARLLDIDTTAAKALAFTVLTVARTGEVIGATWAEIDLDAKVWTIPGDRMKARREHRVPLSEPALAILIAMPGCTGFLFPWAVAPRMSADIMRNVLRDMGFAAATVHGMRSAFRDWCGNETDFAREICEGALAHAIGGAVEQAYRRSDALGKRRALMAAWAAFVIGKNALVTTGEPRARVTAPSLA
jgi:integrase